MIQVLMVAVALSGTVAENRQPNALIEALAHCLEIRVDAERLACTDVAAAKLVSAARARDLIVVTRDDVAKTKRSLFGSVVDQNDVFGGREAPVYRVDRLETTLMSAAPSGNDRWSLVLTEGGRWRTTEPWDNATPIKGMAVVVHKAAMGSYVLTAKGQRSVRVMRVN